MPSLEKTQKAATGGGSALARYRALIVGREGWLALLRYEGCLWLSWVPGALGLMLRGWLWPRLLGSCGQKVYFGTNVTLIHPHRIHLGDRVVIGNGCVLDARNPATERAITIGDDVVLSHYVMVSCKHGAASIGDRIGLGPFTVIQSTEQSPVEIGPDAIVGPQCYLVGGGEYHMDRLDVPMAQQGARSTGVTRIEAGVWLGAQVAVLGGVTVGRDGVVGAGAVVNKSLPERAVSIGVPARVARVRQ